MFYDKCNSSVRRTPVTITADDGRELAGNWFEPLTAPAVGTVVIAPAMATPAAYYAGFATWLADRGHQVLTFDLRGTESVMAMRSSVAMCSDGSPTCATPLAMPWPAPTAFR